MSLRIELQALIELEFDVELTGFSLAEVDILLDDANESSPAASAEIAPNSTVTRFGDVWLLGRHRVICGDSWNAETISALMGSERADLIFTDPPYNVPIDGHVSGLGQTRHREFAMGVGEMSSDAFTAFLSETLGNAAAISRDGAIAFVCMDWRHMGELLSAGQAVFSELKNLCVWNKTNGGMGSFYRSKHELVFVFKVGTAPHTNTFGLGDTGRYRTNVWDYAGINTFRADRDEELSMHRTVKPVALVAEAIKDCSKRGEIVLDPFAGSGTTLIAAEKTGRQARADQGSWSASPLRTCRISERLRRSGLRQERKLRPRSSKVRIAPFSPFPLLDAAPQSGLSVRKRAPADENARRQLKNTQ